MASPLLVVDVQQGFLNDYTHHIPDRIVRLIERGEYDPVLFTLFINTPNSPYRRFLDWHECEREPETSLPPVLEPYADPDRTFTKPGLTGLPDELAAFLRERDVQDVTLCGIDTDMCVLKVAMDIFDRGIRPIILTDCCASTAGLQAHLAGLAVLTRNIGAHQLRDAGLSEGVIAAPVDGHRADAAHGGKGEERSPRRPA
jgi:nicotinamidase-related amidase